MNQAKTIYLLAGGNPRNTKGTVSIIARALEECGIEKPKIAYYGGANGNNLIFYGAMKTLLRDAGAGEVKMLKLSKNKSALTVVRQTLEAADAVFLSGGEVEDGMRGLELYGLADYLRDLYSRGKVFIGVSAGSIMMGAHWVRWIDENNDDTAELFDCLGFIPTTIDTHAEDEDWKELKTSLRLQGPGARGYGIPRDGALLYDVQSQIVALDKALLCYVNDNGQIYKEEK